MCVCVCVITAQALDHSMHRQVAPNMRQESRRRILYSWAERDKSRIGGKPLPCRYWCGIKAPELNFLFIALTFMGLCTHPRSRGNKLGVDWINLQRPSLSTFPQVTSAPIAIFHSNATKSVQPHWQMYCSLVVFYSRQWHNSGGLQREVWVSPSTKTIPFSYLKHKKPTDTSCLGH